MLKKTVFVLMSALILSGVCFAQEESAKEQMKDTTPAVEQEQSAKEQPALEPPALILLRIGSPQVSELCSQTIWTNYTVLPKLAGLTVRLMFIMSGILGMTKSRELNCL